MAPTWILGLNAWPRWCSCCLAFSIRRKVSSISLTCANIGIMMRAWPCAEALRMARNCAKKISGSVKDQRIARKPNGEVPVSDKSEPEPSALSAPTSIVRILTGKPCIKSTTRRYSWYCCSSSGSACLRSINKNSERNKPTPIAPKSTAWVASSGSSILAKSSMATWSIVVVREYLSSSNLRVAFIAFSCKRRYSESNCSSGATMTTPCSPSITSQSPWRIISLAWRTPTTAGISMLRATMAVWEVLPPKSVTNPVKACSLKRSMSCGAMSCATIMESTPTSLGDNKSESLKASFCWALSALSTRSATWRISFARSLR